MTKNKGNLYLIPTPIGNINDITTRSLETLKSIDLIACEDTRNTSKLLSFYNIKIPSVSCHKFNEKEASSKLIKEILDGKNVGYVSDAGLPCISDPGAILVKECIKNDINIIPLPGANAALTALIASGLDTKHFYFYGFLDSQISKKEAELAGLLQIKDTLIFFEAPHRLDETLSSILKILGNRKIVIARELTKIYE